MKCICGYDSSVKGNKPFREIWIEPTKNCAGNLVFHLNNPGRGRYESDSYEVELYVCPECGTVKIDHYSIN